MVVTGKKGNYRIDHKLGSDESLNYYACQDEAGEWRILTIAATVEQNAVVDRIEYLLGRLAEFSELYEEEYAKQNGPDQRVHYDWLFPQVVEKFTIPEQGNRMVNILTFPDVDLHQTFALTQILQNQQRTDLRTNVWIVGRMLKLLIFLHENNVMTPVNLSSFLLEPKNHRLLRLEWSNIIIGDAPTSTQQSYAIKQTAECALQLLGAERQEEGWCYPYPLEGDESRYIMLLRSLYAGSYQDAHQAHTAFYDTVEDLWGRKYHPFTVYARKN